MKITALVIDDELPVLRDTVTELAHIPNLDIKGSFQSLKEAKGYFKENPPVDMLFCDIQMPDLDGLSVRKLLPDKFRLLVYVTGFEERAKEAFDVYADGFVTKPLNYSEVLPLIAKLEERQLSGEPVLPANIYVRDDKEGNMMGVPTEEITQIKVSGNFLAVYAPDLKGTLHMSMKNAMHFFPSDYCMRANQSTLVVYDAIRRIDKKAVYVVGEKYPIEITDIGRAAFAEFKRRTHPSN